MNYVALLRGVNVNGITVKSADLKALFVSLGYTDVRTVLASGNVVFGVPSDDASDLASVALKSRIEGALADRFGYEAWIVLRRQDDLAGLVEACPYPSDAADRHAYLVFSSDQDVLDRLRDEPVGNDLFAESIQPGDGVLYWDAPAGASTDTPFSKALAKTKYKPFVTTRNLRTVMKMLAK